MARVGAAVGSPDLAGAAVQPVAGKQQHHQPATMSSIASYESLVHAVSGAVVSRRVGASRRGAVAGDGGGGVSSAAAVGGDGAGGRKEGMAGEAAGPAWWWALRGSRAALSLCLTEGPPGGPR